MEPLVLVVEDEPMVGEVTCRILAWVGYRCQRVETGGEAAAFVEASTVPVGLAIIDVVLPDIMGPQLAEAILQQRPGTLILFTSAYNQWRLKPPRLDGAPFIPKPYSSEELLSVVGRLLPLPSGHPPTDDGG